MKKDNWKEASMELTSAFFHTEQVDTPWRKAMPKLEGENEYEALDKLDRLEVYQDYIL